MRGNLHREYITLEELETKLREQGGEDASQVKHAALETDGMISVTRRDGAAEKPKPRRKPAKG